MANTNYYPEDAISNMRLLKALADYVGIHGGDEKWVTLGNGSMEIIDMLPQTFINAGDESIAAFTGLLSLRPASVDLRREGYGHLPDKNFEYSWKTLPARSPQKPR